MKLIRMIGLTCAQIAVGVVLGGPLSTLVAGAGTNAAQFLTIPVGGRPTALGGAYSALADDAYATIWNPGGLGGLKSSQLALSHVSYVEDTSYEFGSFVYPLSDVDSFGVSVQYLHTEPIDETDAFGNDIGSFTGSYGTYGLSYGRAFGSAFSIGTTAKFVQATIAGKSAEAFGADVGTFYRLGSAWRLAAVLGNFGTRLRFIDEKDPLPTALRLGVGFQPSPTWTLALEGDYQRSDLTGAHMGLEWNPLKLLSLRAGYQSDISTHISGSDGLSVGAGLHLLRQQFDYTWTSLGDLGGTQYFSMVLQWQPRRTS